MPDAFKLLETRAESIKADIIGDHPEWRSHTDYDLWMEELREDSGRVWYGVIDMGEMYQGAFEWDGRDWHESSGDPHKLVERIIKHREFNARYAR
jgi:hypothetical protein